MLLYITKIPESFSSGHTNGPGGKNAPTSGKKKRLWDSFERV